MTTQPQTMKEYDQSTPAQQAAAFREEIRTAFANLDLRIYNLSAENDSIRHDLETLITAVGTITTGIQHAATATPPAQTNSGQFTEMMIDNIIMTYSDKGEPAYKATGTPYNKFGVRVWPETLPILGIDPASLKPGPNPQPAPIKASVLMQVNDEGKTSPRKVTGKA